MAGFRRLAALLGFLGFSGGFLYAAVSGGAELWESLTFGLALGAVGVIASLLLGWAVQGFRSGD